jgi:ParB-like chromosome segregation protein Spo0J
MTEPQLTFIKISDLKFDPSNPNKLTNKQKKSLRDVIKKFGFLVPIIVDSENNIVDGEHRAEAYSMLGYTEIPGYVVNTEKDYDRKFLRQWFNKFRGEADPALDARELELIMQEEIGAAMLEEYLNIDQDSIKEILDRVDNSEDESAAIEGLDKDDKTDLKRVIKLYFTKHEYPEYEQKFEKLKNDYSVTTETEVVKRLIEHYESGI